MSISVEEHLKRREENTQCVCVCVLQAQIVCFDDNIDLFVCLFFFVVKDIVFIDIRANERTLSRTFKEIKHTHTHKQAITFHTASQDINFEFSLDFFSVSLSRFQLPQFKANLYFLRLSFD